MGFALGDWKPDFIVPPMGYSACHRYTQVRDFNDSCVKSKPGALNKKYPTKKNCTAYVFKNQLENIGLMTLHGNLEKYIIDLTNMFIDVL